MYRQCRLLLLLLSLGFATCGPLSAEENADQKDQPAAPATFTVSGVVASVRTAEISSGTEEIASLELKRIVPHGTEVRKGQAIVWFDTEDIDQRIDKEQTELQLAELDMATAEFAHKQFLTQQELDRAAAKRTFKAARQAFDNYNDVDHEQAIAAAEFSLKSAKESLENVQEELDQLQKMYEEDELTEESEEIVLKRAKSAVETATYRLRLAKTRHQRALEQTIPSQQEAARDTFERAELAHAKTLRELQDSRVKKEIELRKQRTELKQQKTKLETLKAERKALTLQAPFAGLVYHGGLTRGKLGDKPSSLKAGSKATPDQVLCTVVSLDRFQLLAEVDEQQLAKLNVGDRGQTVVKILPDQTLQATVKKLETVPFANNKFSCVMSLAVPKAKDAKARRIVPGLNATVTFEEPTQGGEDEE
ncbi:HlyD family secretion protein [Roseimaritima ulvae]|uniref:HlyD family secretion protein n=2 Tax=Roseimaritima ulvae TaxID=980254 RepID=A0A5B9QQ20_9BACT|nr:HlyD family secretion protein [Roseimaritima ulvae]